MSRDIATTPEYRATKRQELYGVISEVVARDYTHLTDRQKKMLSEFLTDSPTYSTILNEKGWPMPAESDIVSEIKAVEYLKRVPEAFRPVPTAQELARVLLAQQPHAKPTERINLARSVQNMDPDARLEASRGLDMTGAKAPAAPIQNATGKKLAHEMTEAELAAAVREKFGPNLRASQVKAHADMMAANSRPKEMSAVAVIKSKLGAGRKRHEIPPIEWLSAEREAVAAGQTLKALLGV